MQSKNNWNVLHALVNKLVQDRIVKSKEVVDAMCATDRGEFCDSTVYAYIDSPQSIGYNATISAPHMHGYALEYMCKHLETAERVLDVGSGSGYLVAAISKLMKSKEGKVIGIEHIPQLVEKSIHNLQKYLVSTNRSHKEELQSGRIMIIEGDGRLGAKEYAPYDCIHVGAAAPELPQALLDQLKKGGRMLIPVGTDSQVFQVIDKDMNGNLIVDNLLGVRYVPLTSRDKQWKQP